MRFLALAFCATAIIPAASAAQQAPRVAPTGPTLQAATVGFRASAVRADESTGLNAAPVRPHAGQDVAMMAVGVGAMIVGALVHGTAGTIIIIGGAAVALYGLYHYLE